MSEKQKKDKYYKYYVNYYEDLDELTIHDIFKELPEWLANFLKEKNIEDKNLIIKEKNNEFYYYDNQTHEKSDFFNTFDNAYNSALTNKNKDYEIVISKKVYKKINKNNDKYVYTNGNFYFAMSNKQKLYSLLGDYKSFLKIAKDYEKNPKDYFNSYLFITYHPIFWVRSFPKNFTSWDTGISSIDLRIEVIHNEEKRKFTGFLFEPGSHIEKNHKGEEYIDRYVEPDFCFITKDLSQGYIKLAKKIHKKYTHDGVERNISNN